MLLALALVALTAPVPQEAESQTAEDVPLARVHKTLPSTLDAISADASGQAGPGLLVRRRGEERLQYVPWVSEETGNEALRYLKYWGGGELHFLPGRYLIEQALEVRSTPDLTISGTPGAVLEFAPGPEVAPRTLAPLQRGDTFMLVDRPEQMRVDRLYQLYSSDRDNTRVLEVEVRSIEGNRVNLYEPVAFMPMITEIPTDCRVFEDVNIFRVRKSPRLTIQNLVLDGKGRGTVRGHTLYGGIYATGNYKVGRRPTTLGLTVRGCTFQNFEGRGLCVYGIGGLRVESCGFYDIRAQALEIDHFSSGHIINNDFDGAEVGVMVNDAFESLVEGNTIRNCRIGVRVLRIFPQDWVNVGNVISSNRIGPGGVKGIAFDDDLRDGLTGNYAVGNHFIGLGPKVRITHPEGNTVEGNTHER